MNVITFRRLEFSARRSDIRAVQAEQTAGRRRLEDLFQ
jgi:hypothetical protein